MAYKNMTKDEFHEFITKLYYWATSYFPEEMRNQTYELLLTLLDTYYPSVGTQQPSTESDCNMPRVTASILKDKDSFENDLAAVVLRAMLKHEIHTGYKDEFGRWIECEIRYRYLSNAGGIYVENLDFAATESDYRR